MKKIEPPPLSYARPDVSVGLNDFRSYRYPIDDAGFLNGQCRDDGRVLVLQPSGVIQRAIPALLLLSLYGLVVSSTHWNDLRTMAWPGVARLAVLLLVPTVVVVIMALVISRQDRRPWISIDRRARQVHIPRQRFALPISSVVRLQVITFDCVRRGQRPIRTGELQIVFIDGGKEETRCIVFQPEGVAMKRFAAQFQHATSIPVSFVYRTISGEWHVEPFTPVPDSVETFPRL